MTTKAKEERTAAVKAVESWLWRNGSRPCNDAIEVFIQHKATEWRLAKNNGMDVLADSVADVLAEVVAVLKDL